MNIMVTALGLGLTMGNGLCSYSRVRARQLGCFPTGFSSVAQGAADSYQSYRCADKRRADHPWASS